MRTSHALVLSLLAVAAAGCGEKHATGNDKTLDFQETTTTVAAVTTAPPSTAAPATTAKATATTAARTATTPKPAATTAKPAATFAITIRPDGDSRGLLDPSTATVKVGTVVTWTNTDSAARSVVASNGAFTSPAIPPGGTYSWTASAPGTVKYKDGTRPYVLGTLHVS
jgi:plastocyanin